LFLAPEQTQKKESPMARKKHSVKQQTFLADGEPPEAPTRAPGVAKRPSKDSLARKLLLISLVAGLWAFPVPCHAITISSGPSFAKSTNASLAGVLRLTTDIDSRVGVLVNDGKGVWERHFYGYGTAHSVPLLGFKPGRTNEITVTVYDRNRNVVTASQPIVFITDPLPDDFPNITPLHSDPARMEPGYTLCRVGVNARVGVNSNTYAYIVILDSSGEVVWFNKTSSTADTRRLENGDLFMPLPRSFAEVNLLGEMARTWNVPTNGLPVDPHDGVPTGHGTILYLNDGLRSVSAFPTSATDPNAPVETAKVFYQRVVEISATNAAVLHTWSPIDVLDPRRISYLFGQTTYGLVPEPGWDIEHSNAVIEDPSDDSLIVSMRNQNAVIKFSRATGQLHWILGAHENWGSQWQPYLLTPVGSPFAWQYGQHAPILTSRGTLLLYDNGNFRASPFNPPVADSDNYSRAVEYKINEQTMEVSQVWEYGRTNVAERFYTGYEGNAEPEPKTGNVLIDFSAVSFVNGVPPSSRVPGATMTRFKEVTHDPVPQVVFDLAITMYDKTNSPYLDCSVYRAHRIPDLYPHPAAAVVDLAANYRNGVPVLKFSGDDTRSYVIEASSNLVDWAAIGMPSEDQQKTGEFDFQDIQSNQFQHQYYRVLTQ
jgi:arylsulfate sulfotransferase